jgi:transcription initiation factor TFIIH subunit 1
MAQNSSADTDATAITNQMPSEFRDKLNSYFRRSSELLRHFFGIRDSLDDNEGGVCSKADLQKLNKIVKGMEKVYREMEAMRKSLPQSKLGEAMRKMCVPIMDQLDLAFKLHRENASGRAGGGGGFVTVEEL